VRGREGEWEKKNIIKKKDDPIWSPDHVFKLRKYKIHSCNLDFALGDSIARHRKLASD